MKRLALILVAWIFLAACTRPLRSQTGGSASTPETLLSGGVVRQYRLHVPPTYEADVPIPLVINFHGLGSNSQQEEALSGMSRKADQAGFIVVYPDGLDARWSDGPGPDGQADLQFVRDLIAALESKYKIDPQRIYATGISNGGGMTNRLGCAMADTIAAIAPDSGAYNFWQDCQPTRPVPVLAFHGLDDRLVPYHGGVSLAMEPPIPEWAAAWAERDGCGTSPAQSSLPGGVTVQTWLGCQGNAEVTLYTLEHHGHSWPGSTVMPKAITSQAVNATDLMWDFFQVHPLP